MRRALLLNLAVFCLLFGLHIVFAARGMDLLFSLVAVFIEPSASKGSKCREMVESPEPRAQSLEPRAQSPKPKARAQSLSPNL